MEIHQELTNEIDKLNRNINRMCVTDNIEGLTSMYAWASKRLSEIYDYNVDRILKNEE